MKARLPDGYGKKSAKDMMKQAQEMQEKIQEKQAELEETEYKATSGGGAVEVTIRGDYQVTAVRIDPEIIAPDDAEMLEDMVAAAFNEGIRVVKETADKEMEAIQGGFDFGALGAGLGF